MRAWLTVALALRVRGAQVKATATVRATLAGCVQAAAARVCDEDGGVRGAAVALLRALAANVNGARLLLRCCCLA